MRLLFLTHGLPWPLTSGRLRQYHFMRELAQRHSITLASVVGADFRPEHRAEIEEFADRVLTFSSRSSGRRSRWRKLWKRARGFVTGGDPALLRMRSAIADLMRSERFDAVVLSPAVYPAIADLPSPPLVADVCDAVLMHISDRIRHAGLTDGALLRLAYRQRRRLEQRLFERADHLLYATQRDREAGLAGREVPASIVPNGVDTAYWKRTSNSLGRRTIVFTGALDYPPNTDAALQLAHDVFPRVRAQVPDARLLLVGRDPPPALQRAADADGVTVTGFVDDLRPWLERATLFAAPLRFGAGIQNKLLEAMAMEVPVVASSRAADGLRSADGDEAPLERADMPEQMIETIVQRFAGPQPAPPHAPGRRYVERNFNWTDCGRRLESVLEEVVDCGRCPLTEAACQSA